MTSSIVSKRDQSFGGWRHGVACNQSLLPLLVVTREQKLREEMSSESYPTVGHLVIFADNP